MAPFFREFLNNRHSFSNVLLNTMKRKIVTAAIPVSLRASVPPQLRYLRLVDSRGYSTPSAADYARKRRESLEDEFRTTLQKYGSQHLKSLYTFGSFLACYRGGIVLFHMFTQALSHLLTKDPRKRAIKLRETLIRMGPFYIKIGQAVSTRSDILPTVYCEELAKLQDQICPFSTKVAVESVEAQLGPINKLFKDFSPSPIAAASLGQVYKAHLLSGEEVAVKVQRPGISFSLTLDALLFDMIGRVYKRFAWARKDVLVSVNEMVKQIFNEIDYVQEGRNAERFASLYCSSSNGEQCHKSGGGAGMKSLKVPKIYWDYTCTTVLTMEWVDTIKLTDKTGLSKASMNPKDLIDQGLYYTLRQLLEGGYFHGDPHPGNMVATTDGSIAYFDFGMMGNIPTHYQHGLVQMIVHFVNGESISLANDFLSLGFIPEGIDIRLVSDALQASFSDRSQEANKYQDFQGVMNQLFSVMYEFEFSLPPDYALVARALGSLEGTAKILDPDFKVIKRAYPYVLARLIANPSPNMRKILRGLIICSNGSIRWNRLERLVGDAKKNLESTGILNFNDAVELTEDLLIFILSEEGSRVREFLHKDILKAADVFLKEDIPHQRVLLFEVIARILGVMKLAPWEITTMLARISVKPEAHKFAFDVMYSLALRLV